MTKIEFLKELARAWFGSSQQHSIHAQLLKSRGMNKLADKIMAESDEEWEEAKKVNERLVELGMIWHINMISAISNQGKIHFMFSDQSFNSERLIEFLESLIKDVGRKIYLILDNLRAHHSYATSECVEQHKDQIRDNSLVFRLRLSCDPLRFCPRHAKYKNQILTKRFFEQEPHAKRHTYVFHLLTPFKTACRSTQPNVINLRGL